MLGVLNCRESWSWLKGWIVPAIRVVPEVKGDPIMQEDFIQGDSICCALTNNRTIETLYQVLNHYMPGYEKLPGDYGVFGVPEELTFANEDAMLRFCLADSSLVGSFFWNKPVDNPRNIMVGAMLTRDGQLVMSLTMQATQACIVEETYLAELQKMIGSDCGVIYGNQLPEFEDGADFRARYQHRQT
jgi:hypothetical protein